MTVLAVPRLTIAGYVYGCAPVRLCFIVAHDTDTVLLNGPIAGALIFHYPARAVQGFIGGG